MDSGASVGILVAFLAGLLSFLSPCVLPLVPSYVSFITGLGVEELESGGEGVKRVTLLHSLLFVAGFTLIFLLMGASATYVGQLLRLYQDVIARIGGIIIILFGVMLLGVIPIPALSREKRLALWQSLAGEMRPNHLDDIIRVIPFDALPQAFDDLIAAKVTGRVVVEIGGDSPGP